LSRNYETNRRSGDELRKRRDNDESLSKTLSIFSNICIDYRKIHSYNATSARPPVITVRTIHYRRKK